MGVFNWFGEQEHNVFDYKPIYYNKEKEQLKEKFGRVDGSLEKKDDPADKKEEYVPGSYIKGSLRDGRYQKSCGTGSKGQNFIGIFGLFLVFIILYFIAKFYTIL